MLSKSPLNFIKMLSKLSLNFTKMLSQLGLNYSVGFYNLSCRDK
jgi:hypothetical protein